MLPIPPTDTQKRALDDSPLVFYLTPEQTNVMHAVVEINDTCYDGHGQRSFDFLLQTAITDAQEHNTRQLG